MKNQIVLTTLLFTALVLGGCVSNKSRPASCLQNEGCVSIEGRPAACLQNEGCQKKLKSVKHWSTLADSIAEDVAITSLSLKRGVFVGGGDNSEFSRGLASFLRSSLVQKGIQVSGQSKDTLQLNFSVQSVKPVLPRNTAFDLTGSHNRIPFEVVITVSIIDNGAFILHNSRSYYVDQVDQSIFEPYVAPRSIPVTGSLK